MNTSEYIGIKDAFYLLIFLLIVWFLTYMIQSRLKEKFPYYKYFQLIVFLKVLGALSFCLIYLLYYRGGDTISYFDGGHALVNLMFHDFNSFLSIMGNNLTEENWSYFTDRTGWPPLYVYNEPNNFVVCRLIVPLLLIGFNRFIPGAIIISLFSLIGIWKFFTMLNEMYPKAGRWHALSVLFIPSLVFWGSGIMKDTFTLSAALWLIYNFYMVFIKRKRIPANVLIMAINIIVLISVKPYIFIAFLPSALLWITISGIRGLSNNALRYTVGPLVLIGGLYLGYLIYNLLGDNLGEYSSFENILTKAQVTQQDLIRQEAYGANFFDIGDFDTSFGSIVQKTPQAIIAGLFRPFIWHANNPVMVISGLENLILLVLTLFVFIRVGPIGFFNIIKEEPFLIFALLFALIFAFSVGLTTANYGALVRYKIPGIPLFISTLLITYHIYIRRRKEKATEA